MRGGGIQMNYTEAREWIHSRLQFGIKPGLERMEWVLQQLGNPQEKTKYIHVAGTNGKGSTVTYIRNMLQCAGYTVGTFTSPYIEHFNERISVNGKMITDDALTELVQAIKPIAQRVEEETEYGVLTEFEAITVMMFYYFGAIRPVDVVIVEVGLGGRYDSTNVITPMLSVITNIGYDHLAILGDTIEAIASEKAGIIKQGIPVVTAVDKADALGVIAGEAQKHDAPLFLLERDFRVNIHDHTENGEVFTFVSKEKTYENLCLQMKGIHQVKNAATAIKAVSLLPSNFTIPQEAIYEGLRRATWQGRFEILSTSPLIVLDGAHNEEGVTALVDTLNRYYGEKQKTIITCMMNDKDVRNMIGMLETVADELIFTSFDFFRAQDAETLASYSNHPNKQVITHVDSLLERLIGNEMVIFTGSLYFISYVREYILNKM